MASQIEIVNLALIKLGAIKITSMDDDVKEARTMSAAWGIVRDSLLRTYNWRFAIARASLAALVDTPTWGYDYQYQLPADYLRLVQVNDYFVDINSPLYLGDTNELYMLESGKILTNLSAPLKVRYIRRVEDTNDFDPCFANLLATSLAAQCCNDISDSGSLKQSLMDEMKLLQRQALKANAIETASQALPDTSFITARL